MNDIYTGLILSLQGYIIIAIDSFWRNSYIRENLSTDCRFFWPFDYFKANFRKFVFCKSWGFSLRPRDRFL